MTTAAGGGDPAAGTDPAAAAAEPAAPAVPTGGPMAQAAGAGANPSWFMDEGMPGTGDAPAWYKAEKFKSVAAQAAAYPELEKKLGAPREEPPAEYAITVPEEFSKKGIGIDKESALWKDVSTIAREEKLSQKGMDRLVESFIRSQEAEAAQMTADMLQAMGPEGQKIVKDIAGWAKANMDESEFKWLDSILRSDDDFFRFNALLQKHVLGRSQQDRERERANSGPGDVDQKQQDQDRLRAMMDDPRYGKDPAYMATVTREFERVHGTGTRAPVQR